MARLIKITAFLGLLGVACLYYCYHHYQFWTHVRTKDWNHLTEFKGQKMRGVRGHQILVHQDFVPHMARIDQYAVKNRVRLVVVHSYRYENQKMYRTVVTPASRSNHLAGFAIDFNIDYRGKRYFSHNLKKKNHANLPDRVQSFMNDLRADEDLRWGGDFRREDPVHIDLSVNLHQKALWSKASINCQEEFRDRTRKWPIVSVLRKVKRMLLP
jgi:hypothetical protein